MRFLIVIPVLGSRIGGMERFVIEFSTRLVAAGHDVTIITGSHGQGVEIEGVKILRYWLFFPKYFNKLGKYAHVSWIAKNHLRKNKYDVVLAMGYSGIFLRGFVWRASGSPVPLVREARNKMRIGLFSRMLVAMDLYTQELMEKACVRKAKYHMFPSVYLKSFFEKHYGFASVRYFIPCSATGTFYAGDGLQAYDWSTVGDKVKILTVDGLSAETKGRDVIIEALSKIDLSNIKLVAAGSINAKLDETLLRHVVRLGSVDFKKMPDLYKNCDILIFPSLSEGFPNVILEAASFGMPIIASRLEGMDEYFEDGEEIILVEKNNARQLAEKIALLAGSKQLRQNLSENVKKRAQSIDYDVFARELVSFLSSKDAKEKNLLKAQA